MCLSINTLLFRLSVPRTHIALRISPKLCVVSIRVHRRSLTIFLALLGKYFWQIRWNSWGISNCKVAMGGREVIRCRTHLNALSGLTLARLLVCLLWRFTKYGLPIPVDLRAQVGEPWPHILLAELFNIVIIFDFFLDPLEVCHFWRKHTVKVFDRFAFLSDQVLVLPIHARLLLHSLYLWPSVRIARGWLHCDDDALYLFIMIVHRLFLALLHYTSLLISNLITLFCFLSRF